MKKIVFLLLFIFETIVASPISETAGAINSVTPQSGRFFGDSVDAVYFNPSLIAFQNRKILLGSFYMYQNLSISLFDRDKSLDIVGDVNKGNGIYGAKQKNKDPLGVNLPFRTRPTKDLDPRGGVSPNQNKLYWSIGAILPIIKNHLAFGVYALLPVGEMQDQNSFFPDEREANFSNSLHFELYEDRMTTYNAAASFGGGYKWFYAGVGLTLIANATVNALIYTPDAGKNWNKIQAGSSIKTKFIPFGAITIKPIDKLFIGATFHPEISNNIYSKNKITFWYLDRKMEQEISTNILDSTYAFQPMTISLNLAMKNIAFDNNVLFSAGISAEYKQWSHYIDRNSVRPQDNVYWNANIKNEDGTTGNWDTETVDKLKWKDTVNFKAGVKLFFKGTNIGLDLSYIPSPVPNQTLRTNYVDNDKIIIGTGFQYKFETKDYSIVHGFSFQTHILLKRDTYKEKGKANSVGKNGEIPDEFPDSVCDGTNSDCPEGTPIEESHGFQTNNPGYPGFSSSGQIYIANLWVSLYF